MDDSSAVDSRSDVIQLLDVESLGGNAYRARNLVVTKWMRAAYGGQIMGQSLMAAAMCVYNLDDSFLLHSFHCYFVGPMQAGPEVIYRVTKVKEGKNFCSVSVVAVQNAKVSYHCLASFQKPEAVTADLNYCCHLMPAVPHPSDTRSAAISELSDKEIFTIDVKKMLQRRKSIESDAGPFSLEVYLCMDKSTAKKFLAKEPIPPKRTMWLRGVKTFKETDHQNYHRISLAYASDLMLAGLVTYLYPKFKVGLVTSLDHSMWFHEAVDARKWYLHDAELKDSVDGRALNSSRIFNEDGQVVATCMQESLLRPKL